MTQKNDEKIIGLKNKIQAQREKLKDARMRVYPVTNCLLVLDKITYNLHVDSSEMLLIKLNMIKMSADNLGINGKGIMISGYSIFEWMNDIMNFLEVSRNKQEKKRLDELEKQLNELLSDDKKTELEIDKIASMIGG